MDHDGSCAVTKIMNPERWSTK